MQFTYDTFDVTPQWASLNNAEQQLDFLRIYLADPWPSPPYLVDQYLHGHCDLLALAFNELRGWPIYAYCERAYGAIFLIHAFVSLDGARGLDAKGWRGVNHILNEYPSCRKANEPYLVTMARPDFIEMFHGFKELPPNTLTDYEQAKRMAQLMLQILELQEVSHG